jgi:hypothetical protein
MFALGLTHLTIGKNAHHFVKMCPIKSKLFQITTIGNTEPNLLHLSAGSLAMMTTAATKEWLGILTYRLRGYV